MGKLPQIRGRQLVRLLEKDGWTRRKSNPRSRHGVLMEKHVGGRTLIAIIPTKNVPLPQGTLQNILGRKQTRLGRYGLERLINKHGI